MGVVALRLRYYIISHPTFYLVLQFEANWLKMAELLNEHHFEGDVAGNGAAAPRTALQRRSGIVTSFPILRSTFYPNLKQK